MKKKLVLGIVAAALSLSLAVGGTLMLFTAQTETATNVVTLGNVNIQLEETKTPNDTDSWKVINATNNTGLTFNGLPGDTIEKHARVTSGEKSADAYIYVKAEFSVKTSTAATAKVNIQTWAGSDPNRLAIIQGFLDSIVLTTGTSDRWFGGSHTLGETAIGNFYYTAVDGNSLKVLESGASTSDIFKSITLPNWITTEFEGYVLTLDLTAYAVQADNNPYNNLSDDAKSHINENGEGWVTAFKEILPPTATPNP
ncbi:MAG: M73 family metallopeptidase [Oscillospiraceae bacterium]|jgi:predicted ribosomally synthesized peptide with SipW-like signal peptide|nr:M73 family metallopeptidase [Oscillospiraceae bacterium]